MGDMGDFWRDVKNEMKQRSKEKRSSNHFNSIELLKKNNIKFEQLSTTHYRIGEYDFWPSTGKFLHRKTNKYGRGVFNLIRNLQHV